MSKNNLLDGIKGEITERLIEAVRIHELHYEKLLATIKECHKDIYKGMLLSVEQNKEGHFEFKHLINLSPTKEMLDDPAIIMSIFKPTLIMFIYLLDVGGVNVDKGIRFDVMINGNDTNKDNRQFSVTYRLADIDVDPDIN